MFRPVGSVASAGLNGGGPRRLAGLDISGSTLRADLSGLGTAQAVASKRFIDGSIELKMQATGSLDKTTRGYVYDALIAKAYGVDSDDQAAVDRLVSSHKSLRDGRVAFVAARSGADVPVAIPSL